MRLLSFLFSLLAGAFFLLAGFFIFFEVRRGQQATLEIPFIHRTISGTVSGWSILSIGFVALGSLLVLYGLTIPWTKKELTVDDDVRKKLDPMRHNAKGAASKRQKVTLPPPTTQNTAVPERRLSSLERRVLTSISWGVDRDEIAKAAGVSRELLEQKSALLQDEGYMTEDEKLTEKGFEAIQEGGN